MAGDNGKNARPNLADLAAWDARERMAKGEFRAADLTEACLARIAERDKEIGAWAFLDHGYARETAAGVDGRRDAGRPPGPLHGLPVGVKDVIDTKDMPTENGTAIDAGRRPEYDAAIVTLLRAAGAVVIGKTVTTELAFFHPAGTKNPHNTAHTPGGSSSGSAAAVASGMVPLAIGTQTNGSVIRPASFCGVVGYKPSYGLIPRTGLLRHSHLLDTVGVFARTVEDTALLADTLAGYDAGDSATEIAAPPALLNSARSDPPVKPRFAFVKSPVWDRADKATQDGFSELAETLGDQCQEVTLPGVFGQAEGALRTLMFSGFAKNLGGYYKDGGDRLSQTMRSAIEEGRAITALDYLEAADWREALNLGLDDLFGTCNAIITPAAPGEAPKGFETTGDPSFCTLWQLCGVPAISLPLLVGKNGLPVGVQLVGQRGEDARLLRTARWLVHHLTEEQDA